MGKKRVPYNKKGIEQLPNDKPVLYKIKTKGNGLNYVGVAKRGRVRERVSEHFGNIPGLIVEIEQFNSIEEVRKKEASIIKRSQPKYNKQGK